MRESPQHGRNSTPKIDIMQDNQQQLPVVALLVAVVTMFGVVWSQDTGMSRSGVSTNRSLREVATNIDRAEDMEAGQAESRDFVEISSVTNHTVTTHTVTNHTVTNHTVTNHTVTPYTVTTCTNPLPQGRTPGHYRIVDSRGSSSTDSFTVVEITETGIEIELPSENLYKVEQDGILWYYMRIDVSIDVSEASKISSATHALPLIAVKPRRRIAIPQLLFSSFETVRSSISSGYRFTADGVKATFENVVRTPARFFEKLAKATREHNEEKRHPETNPLSPLGIDTASSLDSIFY